ncbi:cardiolipin synthase [Proteiniclasticum sp. BAD-10]|uniref:Cardiolipin synthase n=1 Tax=Proteiniclasticum sediminis TaxID=2804028 RepID=A0A941CUF4_9CLOT|nr:cardiolipin synthase [Proteiniclasticum sediminis]MBR0577458.1 cardiolipin synthase [Proteiniclasticum sediminis]
MNLSRALYLSAYLINFLLALTIIFKDREKPEKSIGWLLIFMLIPFVGLILYVLIGRNWKSKNLKERLSPEMVEFVKTSLEEYAGPYKDMAKLVTIGNGSPLFLYNEVTLFKDGTQKFEALLKDLAKAQHHIHMEYYIVKSDETGRKIFDLLMKKAQEGVKVRFVMDKVGGRRFDKEYLKEVRKSGIELVTYSAHFASIGKFIDTSINYRNHRKMVIIDGTIGYLGGNNIGDEYRGESKFGYWRDTHMRVEGEFVLGLQALFFDDFFTVLSINEESKKWEYDKQRQKYKKENDLSLYFPKSQVTNYLPMQLVYNGPGSPYSTVEQLFLKMISTAKEKIYISSPYFIPSDSLMQALKVAVLSGVDVKIVFPEQYDHPPVGHASMTYIKELLDVGAEFYYYNKNAFYHNKALVVDTSVCTLGTANFDVRSLYYNYEVNAVIYDELTAARMEGLFYDDMAVSRLLTLDEYNAGSPFTHWKESFFRVFSLLF